MPSDAARLVSNMEDLPPLPVVATRVMSLVQDKRTSVEDIARVVGTDQALTAKLIRLANSAEYAFGRRSATARDAIQLLGFLQVRQVAITSSLMAMFNGEQSDGAQPRHQVRGHFLAQRRRDRLDHRFVVLPCGQTPLAPFYCLARRDAPVLASACYAGPRSPAWFASTTTCRFPAVQGHLSRRHQSFYASTAPRRGREGGRQLRRILSDL